MHDLKPDNHLHARHNDPDRVCQHHIDAPARGTEGRQGCTLRLTAHFVTMSQCRTMGPLCYCYLAVSGAAQPEQMTVATAATIRGPPCQWRSRKGPPSRCRKSHGLTPPVLQQRGTPPWPPGHCPRPCRSSPVPEAQPCPGIADRSSSTLPGDNTVRNKKPR